MSEEQIGPENDFDIDLISKWIESTDLDGEISLQRRDLHLLFFAIADSIITSRNMLTALTEKYTLIDPEKYVEIQNNYINAYGRMASFIDGIAKRDLETSKKAD